MTHQDISSNDIISRDVVRHDVIPPDVIPRAVISMWKDEAHRLAEREGHTCYPPNPAGPSPLDRRDLAAAGGAVPMTIVVGSAWLSCTFACGETMWDGTCDFFTYGCC